MYETWITKFYDARFSAEETTEFERLVIDENIPMEVATEILLKQREKKFLQNT